MEKYKKELNQAQFEQINAYLKDTMATGERSDFELQLENDAQLRNEVALMRKMIAVVEAGSFKPEQNTVIVKKLRKQTSNWWYAAVAAVLLVMISLFFMPRKPDSAQLYTAYFSPDPGLPLVMSSTENYTFYDGMVSYQEGDYAAAFRKWERLAVKKGYTDTLHFYMGAALMNRNEPAAALLHFEKLAQSSGPFRTKAKWFQALCLLKAGNIRQCKAILHQLPGDDRAMRLLADLEKI